jgi:hypothetical protein
MHARHAETSAPAAMGAFAKAVSMSHRVGLADLSVPPGRSGTRAACLHGGNASAAAATPAARMAAGSNGPLGAGAYLQMHPRSRQQVITTHLGKGCLDPFLSCPPGLWKLL